MKYLRSYLLVPGAGRRILCSRSTGYRPLRRLTTNNRHSKVTTSQYFRQKRHVSTDGAKKSQLAVVGQLAPPLPPPNVAEIERYVSVQRHSGSKSCPRRESKSYSPSDQSCPRHGKSYFSVGPNALPGPTSYGQFLTESNSLKPSLDPVSLEMAFLPTFHAFRNEIGGLFFANHSSTLEAIAGPDVASETTDPEIMDVERSKSLEALFPTTENPDSGDVIPVVPTRNVKREVVMPRTSEPAFQMLSQGSFDTFLEIHNFQKRDSDGAGGEKSEDICPFPNSEDTLNAPSGSFIIQNDRSSVIIHRDLYITNRILEKLKKMDENPEITPEPTGTAVDHVEACLYDQDVTTVGAEEHIQFDSAALADIAESAVAEEQSIHFPMNNIASGNHPQRADSEACLQAVSCQSPRGLGSYAPEAHSGTKLASPSTKVSPSSPNIHTVKSDSYLNNIEFGMPTDRMSALEYMAFHSRKNLYTRMKDVSSPCVLVDGIHVKHAMLEDVVAGKGNSVSRLAAKAENSSESNRFGRGYCETNAMSDDLRNSPASVDSSNNTVLGTNPIPLITSTVPHNSTLSEASSLLLPESNTIPLLGVPYMIDSTPQHSDIGSQFKDILDLTHSETMTAHAMDQRALDEFESDKLQSELEDWFIPLGKEIESMLITLGASKNLLECPERIPLDSEENLLIFEEEISNFKDRETSIEMEHDGSHPFEGVDIIENALLSPRGHQPFESGQSRDKTTSSGSLPPKSKNPNVDIKTETTIKCCRSGENTDINVTETQRYLDKRLPYPFCTETVLQVYGTSDSLSKATQAVENSKAQLVHLSNANSPNPGMLTRKLQFNHMLSKSHENFKPNSKKTVLKIKVVPNTETSLSSSATIRSSEPKPQPSHILQLTEQPAETSTDVSKLIRSKFNHKTGPKKVRRGDSVMKLRPKKKFNKESTENIKILTPKDLEQMFPSPPKPKPVEKPRKVTIIETKMGKESPEVIENVKQRSTQGGFMAAQFKSRKVQDDMQIKPSVPRSQIDTKVVNQSEVEVQVPHSMKPKKLSKEESNAALSTLDQKMLKSIISHKVKDSFIAVSKKVVPEVVNEVAKPDLVKKGLAQVSLKPEAPIRVGEPKTIVGIADQTKSSTEMTTKPLGAAIKPKSAISETVDSFSPPEIKHNVNESGQVYQNDSKTVYASILGSAKQKPVKEKAPLKVPKPRSPRPESPTPKPNREYVTVKTEPTPTKTTAVDSKATPEKAPHTSDQKTEKKLDDSVLPVSASTIIANVMKSSSDMSQSESSWRHLDNKTAPNQNPSENFSRGEIPLPSDVQRRPIKSNVQQKILRSKVNPQVINDGEKTSPIMQTVENKDIGRIQNIDNVVDDSFKGKKVWNLPSEPLFFPFETPNYKEMLQELSQESHSIHPIPRETSAPKSSADPAVHEVDFCKLSAENVPGLVESAPARYRVPLDRMKNFPLVNPGKAKSYSVPSSGAMSISPLRDLMLRRNLSQVPAVTKILGATLSAKSQQALDRWKQGLISTLGEEGFQEFYQNQLKRGTDFHSSVKKFLVDHLDCKDDLCMRSLSSVLGSVSDVGVVESQVIHPLLGYRGVVDCVAKYKGKPVVIEWKRSDKAKPSLKHTYDAPLQLTAYFGAMNFDSNYKAQQVEGGVVVVAYSDGSPADVYELAVEECERYWAKWLRRLHQYYIKSASP